MELTRRLATVVMADVVGYSRQMERDEASTVQRLRAMREEVVGPETQRFRGRVVDTAGDGWLAEFASVTDAVRSCLAIHTSNFKAPPLPDSVRRVGLMCGPRLPPRGWSRHTRNWSPIEVVTLNPEREAVAGALANGMDKANQAA